VASRGRAVRAGAVACVVAALFALGLGGCARTTATADPATITIGLTAEPVTLDLTTTSQATIPTMLLWNVYEGLVRLDDAGRIVPLLARSWSLSPDRLSLTFRLRPATFHDGTACTSDDVKFSLDRARDPRLAHPFARSLSAISQVLAPDPATVVLRLSRPSNSLLYTLTGPVGVVLSSADPASLSAQLASAPVGTGPLRFLEWRRGERLVLERVRGAGQGADASSASPSGAGSAALPSRVVWRFFTDATAMTNAMLADDLDVIANVQAPQTLTQFTADPSRFRVLEGTTNGEVVLAMNNSRPVLADVRVRQAIRRAIDHKAVRDLAWSGYGTLIGSMVPPTDPWYEDLTGVAPYDPAGARRLLAEAGATNLRLLMRPANLPYAVASAQIVAAQLRDVGITVEVEPQEFPAAWLATVLTRADYDLSIISHVEPRDIVTFADPKYYWRYDDPVVQRLLAAADAGPPSQEAAGYAAAARRISERAAADWLFLLPNLVVTRTTVSGLATNAVGQSFDVTGARKAAPAGARG
jgi:peptide/nickel transport system substrate-binding protein